MLQLLQAEFADVTISKIRFLEAEGLVTPARTASGYRKFSAADVERLRYVLTAQRDQYLPLKVIKEHLAAMDRGLRPSAGGPPVAPSSLPEPPGLPVAEDFGAYGTELRLTREELRAARGHPGRAARPGGEPRPGGGPRQPLRRGRAAGRHGWPVSSPAYGIEPRHLRPFRTAADREAGLIEQVTGPRRTEKTEELAALAVRLHAALVRSRLPSADRRTVGQPAHPRACPGLPRGVG